MPRMREIAKTLKDYLSLNDYSIQNEELKFRRKRSPYKEEIVIFFANRYGGRFELGCYMEGRFVQPQVESLIKKYFNGTKNRWMVMPEYTIRCFVGELHKTKVYESIEQIKDDVEYMETLVSKLDNQFSQYRDVMGIYQKMEKYFNKFMFHNFFDSLIGDEFLRKLIILALVKAPNYKLYVQDMHELIFDPKYPLRRRKYDYDYLRSIWQSLIHELDEVYDAAASRPNEKYQDYVSLKDFVYKLQQ